MKTLVLTTALVVLTTLTYAQPVQESPETVKSENITCNLYPSGGDQVTLILMKETDDKVIVKLKKENGSLVYQKRIKKSNDNKITYDLEKLPKGSYTFEVVNNKEVVYSKALRKGEGTLAMTK